MIVFGFEVPDFRGIPRKTPSPESPLEGLLGRLIKEALDFDQFNAKYDKWAKTQASLPSNGQKILAPAAPWSSPGLASAAPGPALPATWLMPAAPWAGPQGEWNGHGVYKRRVKNHGSKRAKSAVVIITWHPIVHSNK